jgi:hypothetical protein
MSFADIIDIYALEADYWPHIPYQPVGELIVEAAALTRVGLPAATALCEWESGFKLIFGCDQGALFCHKPVTARRIKLLLDAIEEGEPSQGVGLTQITAVEFIKAAEELGGAEFPANQLRVGLGHLRRLIDIGGLRWALAAYNGGPGNPNHDYAEKVLEKRDEWRVRFADG